MVCGDQSGDAAYGKIMKFNTQNVMLKLILYSPHIIKHISKVVCGGLGVVCGGLRWFGVVCGGLQWFAVIRRSLYNYMYFLYIHIFVRHISCYQILYCCMTMSCIMLKSINLCSVLSYI